MFIMKSHFKILLPFLAASLVFAACKNKVTPLTAYTASNPYLVMDFERISSWQTAVNPNLYGLTLPVAGLTFWPSYTSTGTVSRSTFCHWSKGPISQLTTPPDFVFIQFVFMQTGGNVNQGQAESKDKMALIFIIFATKTFCACQSRPIALAFVQEMPINGPVHRWAFRLFNKYCSPKKIQYCIT